MSGAADDGREPRKAVRLRPPGECPVWGIAGVRTPLDAEIEKAKDGPLERQRELFFGCARHLYDNQVRDNVPNEHRNDPSDNDQWLADLAAWFGWSDELRDEVKKDAMRSAAQVLSHEMPDYEPPS